MATELGSLPSDRASTAPARKAAAITTNDTTEITVTRGIYVGVTGDVVAILVDDTSAVTFKAVPAGTILPIQARIVTTASTATNMLALYGG